MEKLPFSLAAIKFCTSLPRPTPAVPNKTFFQSANQYTFGRKNPFALCCVSIFFHVKTKQPCLDQTQKPEIPFQNPFEAGNQLDVSALSQSASSNHALFITNRALKIKGKRRSVSANLHSVILSCT